MKKAIATILVLAILVGGALSAVWLWPTDVLPDAPPAPELPSSFATATSRISIPIDVPATLIRDKLEQNIPKEFPLNVTEGTHVTGKPARGPIAVQVNTEAKNLTASTTVSGKIQVAANSEATPVEIDVTGTIAATVAPELRTGLWSLDPRLQLVTKVDRAVAKTRLGDVDVTRLVQTEISRYAEKGRLQASAELEKLFDVHDEVEKAWSRLNDVVRLSEQPPTWLRVMPRQVEAAPPLYSDDKIKPRLLVECRTQVFIGPEEPAAPKTAVEPLRAVERLPDESELEVPIALPYSVMNEELKRRFTEAEFRVSKNISIVVDDAQVAPHGEGVLLTVKFRARRNSWTAASGTLYVSGRPQYDPEKAELRFVDLDYSTETRNVLLKSADWVFHSKLLERLKAVAVLDLSGPLEKAKRAANDRLKDLAMRFEEVRLNAEVARIRVERIGLFKETAMAIVSVRGRFDLEFLPDAGR